MDNIKKEKEDIYEKLEKTNKEKEELIQKK